MSVKILYIFCPTVTRIKLPGKFMVLISDGNSEHGARAWKRIDLFGEKNATCDYSRSNQMP